MRHDARLPDVDLDNCWCSFDRFADCSDRKAAEQMTAMIAINAGTGMQEQYPWIMKLC
jgi:hypothetical protein